MGPLDRARADQVGSLLRPAALKAAFAAHEQHRIDDAALAAAQDDAVLAVVAMQERRGMPILTDGELRQTNFQDSLARSVAGFDAWRDRWRNRPAVSAAPHRATLITRHAVTERRRGRCRRVARRLRLGRRIRRRCRRRRACHGHRAGGGDRMAAAGTSASSDGRARVAT